MASTTTSLPPTCHDRCGPGIDEHVGPRTLTDRVARVLLQPLVERQLAARESLEDVGVAQRFDAIGQAIRRRSRARLAARARRGARSARSIVARILSK